MRRISHALLDGIALPPGALLEIGCGAGAFLTELTERFPERLIAGSDLHPLALERAALLTQARLGLMRADLHHLPLPPASCAAIIALDVYDQQGVDLKNALLESRRVLSSGGILMLRVSAFSWLQGPHDLAFGTGRRFSAQALRQALGEAGLQVLRLTYANSLLLGPGVAVRLLQRLGLMTEIVQGFETAAPLNQYFAAILTAEARWLRQHDLPAGLSLYAIAGKPGVDR
jgi:SAM-dependent methyltransferase